VKNEGDRRGFWGEQVELVHIYVGNLQIYASKVHHDASKQCVGSSVAQQHDLT